MTLVSRSMGFVVFVVFLGAIGFRLIGFVFDPQKIVDVASGDKNVEKPVMEAPKLVANYPLKEGLNRTVPVGFPANFLIEDFDLNSVRVIHDARLEDIKDFVSKGSPVVAFLDTRLLKNPYYTDKDYVYATVIGYTETHLITRESGMPNKGKFVYVIEDFMNALKAVGGDIYVLGAK